MEDVYSIKFYVNDEEVEFEVLPTDYVNGLAKVCADKVSEDLRWRRVISEMADNINKEEVE